MIIIVRIFFSFTSHNLAEVSAKPVSPYEANRRRQRDRKLINKSMKYVVCFIILIFICFLSFAVTFGYEEGTMKNKYIGESVSKVFKILKFPFTYILPIKFYLLGLILNICIYTIIVTQIFYTFSKK